MSAIRVFGTVSIIVLIIGYLIAQPTLRKNKPSTLTVDTSKLEKHVITLSRDLYPRNWQNTNNLEKCADYIAMHFTNAGATVESQVFEVNGKKYRNVIGRFGVNKGAKIIIGAHYDSCEKTPGADDNASGIAALIELAYLFGRNMPDKEVELVAYTLEEPPFFGTKRMGSAIHAKSIADKDENIAGVIVLEMVGYFSDEKNSQSYPLALLRLIYPDTGNFIAVIGPLDQGPWIKTIKAGMKQTTDLPVYSIRAPSIIPGVDFSDHRNYWPYGINALMITDTAFYRNNAYHSNADTADRLDYHKMAKVVIALFEAVKSI